SAILDHRIPDVKKGTSCESRLDAILALVLDNAVQYVQALSGVKLNSVSSGGRTLPNALKRKASNSDNIIGSRAHIETGRSGVQDRSKRSGTIDRDCFGDCERAEAARIQCINLTTLSGL